MAFKLQPIKRTDESDFAVGVVSDVCDVMYFDKIELKSGRDYVFVDVCDVMYFDKIEW